MAILIGTAIVPSAVADEMSPARVAREFDALLNNGAELKLVGGAKKKPKAFLKAYRPRFRVTLFDTAFYLTGLKDNPAIRFFVVYVVQQNKKTQQRVIRPRIFYKDVSLVWRCASHMVETADETWIGKGDTMCEWRDGEEYVTSAESTTDLPIELQAALDTLSRASRRIPKDDDALGLVLQQCNYDRILPYPEFTAPRRKAARNPRNLIHGGKSIARFTRKNDPSSLKIAKGFEPDFKRGVIETSMIRSNLYGGDVMKHRVLSTNRKVQYLFMHAPRHVWIIPPQALTTDLSSFGLRTVDVVIDENLCVPGFEYHFMDDTQDPPALHTQIPEGYAGEPSAEDPSRADASKWIDRLPVVREFRRMMG